jgi:hypothetical protein
MPDPSDPVLLFSLLLSFVSGFVIGATEIISTFQFRKKLLATPSFWLFLILYGSVGTMAFAILSFQYPQYWKDPLSAFLIGLAPHVVLRSRFSLLRSRDENGGRKLDVSLDLEKVFSAWVRFIKGRIDVSSMPERRRVIEALISRHPTIHRMRTEAVKVLYALQTMDETERTTRILEIEDLFESAEDERDEICLYKLADITLRYSDFDALKNSLNGEETPPEAGADMTTAEDPVERFLAGHPDFLMEPAVWQDRLTDAEWRYLNEKILDNPDIRDKPRIAAKFLHKRGYLP